MVVVDRVRVARQDAEDFAEAGLLALEFVDQAAADGLLAQQVARGGLDEADVADADDGGRGQQQDHQREAGDHDPEDALPRDLLRHHRVFSIARGSGARRNPKEA